MYSIETIKTWHGKRWSVVDSNRDVVEYKRDGKTEVAMFNFDTDGHSQAKELLKELKK